MTLMNMFDLFDFDENGKLSREEFDIYNILASDEHVLDQVRAIPYFFLIVCLSIFPQMIVIPRYAHISESICAWVIHVHFKSHLT